MGSAATRWDVRERHKSTPQLTLPRHTRLPQKRAELPVVEAAARLLARPRKQQGTLSARGASWDSLTSSRWRSTTTPSTPRTQPPRRRSIGTQRKPCMRRALVERSESAEYCLFSFNAPSLLALVPVELTNRRREQLVQLLDLQLYNYTQEPSIRNPLYQEPSISGTLISTHKFPVQLAGGC